MPPALRDTSAKRRCPNLELRDYTMERRPKLFSDALSLYGGEAGIRTLDDLRHNGFRDRRFRPLSHLSAWSGNVPLQYLRAAPGLRANIGGGALGENRTPDALLRTEALYPLSYKGTFNGMADGQWLMGEPGSKSQVQGSKSQVQGSKLETIDCGNLEL